MSADETTGKTTEAQTPQTPTTERPVTFGQVIMAMLFWPLMIMALVAVAGYFLAGCTSVRREVIRPKVIDSAKALSEMTVRRIEALQFPADVPVIIRIVEGIGPEQVGSFATDSMEKETDWETMRPRPRLRRIFRGDSSSSTAVYVLISQRPALLQIRYGKQLRLPAYRTGIACGEWYIAQQRIEPGQLEHHLLQTITNLMPRLAKAVKPSWLIGKLQALASMVWSEFEDWTMPSDNFLTDTALKVYVRLISVLGGTAGVWRFLLTTFGCYVVVWLGLKKWLVDRVLVPRIKRPIVRGLVQAITAGTLAGFLATGLAALVILGRGRIEDQMALEYLGLSSLGGFTFDPVMFARGGGIWFAAPVAVIVFFKDLLEHNVVDPEPNTSMLPLGFLSWAAAFYLLPKAICIFALFFVLKDAASVLVSVARAEGRSHATNEMS